MERLILSLLAVTFMFLAPELAKAERFEAIPAAIIDTETGLMWLSEPCCIHGSWEESDAFTAGLDYAGYQDWRTPTIEELEALLEAIGNPCNFRTESCSLLFNDMQRYYWTTDPYMAFDVSDSTSFYDDVNPYWIWPVRTAFIPPTTDQPIAEGCYDGSGNVEGNSELVLGSNRGPIGPPVRKPSGKCCTCSTGDLHADRWCDNGDGTVTDLTTCLVWLQKADWGGLKPWRNPSTDCGHPNYTCYDDANARAGVLRAGTDGANLSDGSSAGDWRLPTRTELVGLVNGTPNLRCPSGTCDRNAFTGLQSSCYWSSSTFEGPAIVVIPSAIKGATKGARGVCLSKGTVFIDNKSVSHYVWPVRSGN